MSGGSFDHNCFRISQFADELGLKIRNNKTKDDFDCCPNFSEATLKRLKKCHHIIEKAGELAKEVEWLYSGDTGEESFANAYYELMEDWEI